MAFDYKKEYKEFYQPKQTPGAIDVPPMSFLAVRGCGDPNAEGGAYKAAIGLLYGVAYTLRMSRRSGHEIEGFFDYVVPPLEGLWWQDGVEGVDYARKSDFQWISMIRLPDFVKRADCEWAIAEASRKKGGDFSPVEFFEYTDGLCVQCMHVGPYDDEPATIARMERFASEQGFALDHSDVRRHHEIYLSDVNRVAPERLRTVIRLPVRRVD